MKRLLPILFLFLFSFARGQNDLIDFETPPLFVTIDSLTGVWQIGTPSKTIFDTAYSPTHALMTDTINNYPNGTVSYAYFTFPDYPNNIGYSLSFEHRYETESGKDGGRVEMFDCMSSSWVPVDQPGTMNCNYYFLQYNQNMPSTLLPDGETYYSGSSTGWVHSEINFYCGVLFDDPSNRGGGEQLRFVFVSDSVNNDEGWIIDNLVWTEFIGTCWGIEEGENQIQLSVFPTHTNGTINFESGNEFFNQITLYDISGKLIENFSFSITNFKTLELSKLANGMYFYLVDEGKAKGKFVIEK